MTKRNIAKQIAERLGVHTPRASEVVQQVFDGIVDTLVNEGRIELRKFGVFEVRKRKSRQARNPRTGEIVGVPERFGVTFKPGRAMQQRVASFVPRPFHELMPIADRTALK